MLHVSVKSHVTCFSVGTKGKEVLIGGQLAEQFMNPSFALVPPGHRLRCP